MDPVKCLISEFEDCLGYFERNQAEKSKPGPYIQAMKLREKFANAGGAIDDDDFLTSLRDVLSGWWRLRRAELLPLNEFKCELRKHKPKIQQLEQFTIETVACDRWSDIWSVIESLKITRKRPRLVSGTKVLHHILPELVVPVDRLYMHMFLFAYRPRDYEPNKSGECERETFRVAFQCFSQIAKEIRSKATVYQGRHEAHTNITKLIDNAIFGFVELTRRSMGGGAWNP